MKDNNKHNCNTCENCKHWIDKTKINGFGECEILSATYNKSDLRRFDWELDPEKTGVVAWPQCSHDGHAIEYETKPWFGCIHFSSKHASKDER